MTALGWARGFISLLVFGLYWSVDAVDADARVCSSWRVISWSACTRRLRVTRKFGKDEEDDDGGGEEDDAREMSVFVPRRSVVECKYIT